MSRKWARGGQSASPRAGIARSDLEPVTLELAGGCSRALVQVEKTNATALVAPWRQNGSVGALSRGPMVNPPFGETEVRCVGTV